MLALWPAIQECPSATHLKILTEEVNHPGISHALFTVYTDFSHCSMEVCCFDTGPACIKAELCYYTLLSIIWTVLYSIKYYQNGKKNTINGF